MRGSQSQSSMGRFNTERSDQYFPNQPRNVTYVSRLQALQAAVDHQLQEMAKNHMKRGVALVTFNSEVPTYLKLFHRLLNNIFVPQVL